MPCIAYRARSKNDGIGSYRVKANRNTTSQHGSRLSKGKPSDMPFPNEDNDSSGMRAVGIQSSYIRSRIWRQERLGEWNTVVASIGSAANALNTTGGDLHRGKKEGNCVLDVSIDDRIYANCFPIGTPAFEAAPDVTATTAKPLGGMHCVTPVLSLSTPRDHKLCHSSSTPPTMGGVDVLNTSTRQEDNGDGDSHSVHPESCVRKNSGGKDLSKATPKPRPPLPTSSVNRSQTSEGAHYTGQREDYALGDTVRSISHMIIEPAMCVFDSLRNHDFVFIKRSNGSFSYAGLAYRSRNKITNEECFIFILDIKGSTKTVPKRQSRAVRLVSMEGLTYHPPIGMISFDPQINDDCSVISSVSDRARASSRRQKYDGALHGVVGCRLVGDMPKPCASPNAHQRKLNLSQRHEENHEQSYQEYTPRAA